jgi:hypothetical protein
MSRQIHYAWEEDWSYNMYDILFALFVNAGETFQLDKQYTVTDYLGR